MSATNRPNMLKYAIVLAPLFLGCGSKPLDGSFQLPAGGLVLPDCTDSQILGSDQSGKLVCLSVSTAKVDIPDCKDTQAITSDGTKLLCVDKGMGGNENANNVRITNLTTKIEKLTTTATDIKNKGGGALGTYVGNTTASFNGNFVAAAAGSDNGFVGAAKVCENQYGTGAHLCTVSEIYNSAVKGAISSTKNIAKAWVYFPSWKNPVAGSLDPLQGAGDTCGSLTYPTGDLKWTGVAVSTGALRTTRWGVRLHGGSEAPCNAPLPISCCK